jgi:hypothetical protein
MSRVGMRSGLGDYVDGGRQVFAFHDQQVPATGTNRGVLCDLMTAIRAFHRTILSTNKKHGKVYIHYDKKKYFVYRTFVLIRGIKNPEAELRDSTWNWMTSSFSRDPVSIQAFVWNSTHFVHILAHVEKISDGLAQGVGRDQHFIVIRVHH